MNDKKIDELLSQYSENLGRFAGTMPQPKLKIFWKPILATAVGAGVLATFTLVPRNAEAAPVDGVAKALAGQRYWSATVSMHDSKSKIFLEAVTETYLDGIHQSAEPETKRNRLIAIIDSGNEYLDYKNQPYLLKFSFDKSPGNGLFDDPMKHALHWGHLFKGQMIRKDGIRFNNQEAYSLTVKNSTGKVTFELIVQKQTDLPMQILMLGKAGKEQFVTKTEYRYDQPKGMTAIKANPTKPIFDVAKERAKLVKEWNNPNPSSKEPVILSSTISPDGTIWVAARVSGDNIEKGSRSIHIDTPNYVDSIHYPVYYFGETPEMKRILADVSIASFVPLYEAKARPSKVTVKIGRYTSYQGVSDNAVPKFIERPLINENQTVPSYLLTIITSIYPDEMKSRFWGSRADGLKKKGDYKAAIDAYMAYYVTLKQGHSFVSAQFSPLTLAAECYEKLGNKAKAQELRRMVPKGHRAQY